MWQIVKCKNFIAVGLTGVSWNPHESSFSQATCPRHWGILISGDDLVRTVEDFHILTNSLTDLSKRSKENDNEITLSRSKPVKLNV